MSPRARSALAAVDGVTTRGPAVPSRRSAPAGASPHAHALTLLRIAVGVFLLVKCSGKIGWLVDAEPLVSRLTRWAANEEAIGLSRWYAGALLPGAWAFARLSFIGELGAGLALIAGFRTRVIAALAALMILNFHLATGGLISPDFLSDASGLLCIAALAALVVGGRDLPFSVRP
jgi:uncharacterized membrane protein YphA (DoxX/SURF4 family)